MTLNPLRKRVFSTTVSQGRQRPVALFLNAARRRLTKMGLSDQIQLTIPTRTGPEADAKPVPQRRTMRVHDVEIVGYELIAEGLTAEESITLQIEGLGGKRHMGCGVFVPVVEKAGTP